MSAVVEAVSDVGEAIGDAVESVGKIAESTVREIGKGAESLGREVGKIGQAAINDPVGTIAKVAAVATQQYWALPLISATTVVANGGDLGQAAMAAGISYAGMYIASGISDYLASGSESALMGVENAADGSTLFTYSDGSTMLQTADGLTKFTAPTAITGSLNTAISNAAGNIATTALRGGDLSQILTSGLTGGVGTYANLETTQALKDFGLAAPIANVLGTTTGAVARGVLSGQDAGQVFNTALISNIIDTSLAQAGNQIKQSDVFKTLQSSVNEKINEFKDAFNEKKQAFLDSLGRTDDLTTQSKARVEDIIKQSEALKTEAENYKNNALLPAQELAQRLYGETDSAYKEYKSLADQYGGYVSQYDQAKAVSDASYNEYKSKSDEFSSLVAQYDQAKANGDTDLANSLADKANALIPSLNAAVDKYNTDADAASKIANQANEFAPTLEAAAQKYNEVKTTYDNARTDFESKNQNYASYNDKFQKLDTDYVQINKELEAQRNATKQAGEEFSAVNDQIKQNTDEVVKKVDSAYKTAADYSPIAFDTFKNLYKEDGNLDRASNLSQQVNSLPIDNQRLYDFSTNFGLKPEDAIEFAPDLSKMSWVAKQTFYESLAQDPDTTKAFNVANNINSLSEDAQDSFFSAKMKGLDTATAYNVASVVGGRSQEQQQTYIDTIKSGLGSQLADIFTAAQSLVSGPGTKLQDVNETNLAELKTQEAKDAYQYYLLGNIDPNEAFALAKGQDYAVLSQGTGTQFASTTGDYSATFSDANYWDPVKKQWIPLPVEGEPNGGFGGGTGTGTNVGVSGTQSYKPLTQEEIQQFRDEGIPEEEIQKLVGKYGIYSEPISANKDYYQQLIDTLFTSPQSKAKKLATTPTTPGTGTGAGTTTGTGTGAGTTTGTGTGTSGTPTGGTTTGGTTPGGSTGTAPTGGTTTGGTDTTGGGGTGTGGTGTGGTGTGTGGTGTGGGGFGIGGIGGGGFAIPGGMYGMYGLTGQDKTGGIKNLTAGLTERMDYNLAGLPSDQDNINPMYNAPQVIPAMATGGTTSTYNPFSTGDPTGQSGISSSLTPNLTKAQLNYILTGLPDYIQGKAEGGEVKSHNPQFFSEGGLGTLENRYVKGDGDGTSDSVPAMLADGEFVIPADVVSSLGNGSNNAGASILDQFLRSIRDHKRKANSKDLPPDSKGPLAYLIDAQRRAKA